MKDFHHSCQGESHIAGNKVCQDASFSYSDECVSIAIVCDGHGGDRYFRSDIGSKMAVEATKECVITFVCEIGDKLFVGKEFTQKSAIATEANSNVLTKDTDTDKALRQLFSSIIFRWRTNIERHSVEYPLSKQELQSVKPEYIADFKNGNDLEKTYGCTLMCYVLTQKYWFAFHLGDGKCIAFDMLGNWSEPIPWDEKCFLNKTTSLCDSSAIDEFRYCYCGDGSYPLAVFLGSDGIDDSFGDTENMVNFYIQILKTIGKESIIDAKKRIIDTLPQLSKIGSKDDMSIAFIYDERELGICLNSLILWQKENVRLQIQKLNERILSLKKRIVSFDSKSLKTMKEQIDLDYATKELNKAFCLKNELARKHDKFLMEISNSNIVPYSDVIGLSNSTIPVLRNMFHNYQE